MVSESKIEASLSENINLHIKKILKSISKVEIINENGLNNKYGIGFLLNFDIDQEKFYCLMSNEIKIEEDSISNKTICIHYEDENKKVSLKLDEKERYIKSLKEYGSDITVFEILNKDDISEDCFLFPELDIINNDLINSQIYMIKYEGGGKESTYSRGKLIEINKFELVYIAIKGFNSSRCLIFLENSFNVLGFDKIGNGDKSKNYGIFISPIINIIKNDIRKRRNNELQLDVYEEKKGKKPTMILKSKNAMDCGESNEQFDDYSNKNNSVGNRGLSHYLQNTSVEEDKKNEKEVNPPPPPTIKIDSEIRKLDFNDIIKILQNYSFSFNSDCYSNLNNKKNEINEYKGVIKDEEIIIYNSFMKLMEFIQIKET